MFNISADIAAAERLLSDLGRTQLPFATAMAINDTAEAVRRAEELDLPASLDRPTPFTRRGLYLRRASKARLVARVGVKTIQAEYLRYQVAGGVRTPAGRALVVPVNARRNAYGNLPRGAIERAKARSDVFVTDGSRKTKHLPGGVYQRPRKSGGQLKQLIAFEPRATYRKRWRFHELAMRRARAVFARNFYDRLQQAIATARR